MKKSIFAIANVIGMLSATPLQATYAECHLASQTAILCQSSRTAADAFHAFGFDSGKMKQSYNLELLHEAACSLITDTEHTLSPELMSSAQVATPKGWVPISTVNIPHGQSSAIGIMASAYLRGTCRAFVPTSSPSLEIPEPTARAIPFDVPVDSRPH